MINPAGLDDYLEETYGTRDALIVRDSKSPAGLREWTPEDSESMCRWADQNGNPGGHENPGRRGAICRNLRETAQAVGVSTQTVQGWMRRRDNPLPHLRDGRRIIIPDFMLIRWIKEEAERNLQERNV